MMLPLDLWQHIFRYLELNRLEIFLKLFEISEFKIIFDQLTSYLPKYNLTYLCYRAVPLDVLKFYFRHPQTDLSESSWIDDIKLDFLSAICYQKKYTDQETLEMIKLLVEKKVDLNPKSEIPPIFGVILSNKPMSLRYLLQKDANLETKIGFCSDTPLSFATRYKKHSIMEILLRYRPSQRSLVKSFKNSRTHETFDLLKNYCLETNNIVVI